MANYAPGQQRQTRQRRPEFTISSAVSGIVGGDGSSRVRSLSEQERQIVNRVLGGDKSTVWHVCQNLRDNDVADDRSSSFDLGSYGPEFRKRSCWKPRGSRASAASSGSRASATSPPIGGDRKSRMSVARTQEASPCPGSAGPPRRASKLAEKVIAKHRWSEQASSGAGSKVGTEFLRGEQPKSSSQRQRTRPEPAELTLAATETMATESTASTPPPGSSPLQPPPPPAQVQFHLNATQTTMSRSPSSSSSSTLSSNSSNRRRRRAGRLAAAGAAPDETRRRIRFLPLAEAIDQSSGCGGSGGGFGDVGGDGGGGESDDWDLGDLEIRRLIQRRQLDRLMKARSGRTIRPGFEQQFY